MARGSSYGEKPTLKEPAQNPIPKRATRKLSEVVGEEEERETEVLPAPSGLVTNTGIPVYEFSEHPLARHRQWLNKFIICTLCAVLGMIVLISAGMFQRTGDSNVVNFQGGQSFPIQVGGSLNNIIVWENSTGPIPPSTAIPTHAGPYSVLSAPTITADFINRVLASYNSPAAGKGQALYNYGVQYGIDPAFALAFFLHESQFGTAGVARI